MTNELQQAMEAKAAAAQALADAEKNVREIALANYNAARDAAIQAGVKVAAVPSKRSPVTRAKLRVAGLLSWERKTPEQREAWKAAIQAGRKNINGATVQGVQ